MRAFVGAPKDAGLTDGSFATTGKFTRPARDVADRNNIQLVNLRALSALIRQCGGCADPDLIEAIRDKRKFRPKCESKMVLRMAGKGPGAGDGV